MTTDDIEVFGHNSIRGKAGNKNIYIDPFEMKISPKDADFILITHDHYDHFSPEILMLQRKKRLLSAILHLFR